MAYRGDVTQGLLQPSLWERLRQRMQRNYRAVTGETMAVVSIDHNPTDRKPVAWRYACSMNGQGYDTKFSEHKPEESDYVHDVTPLYE